MVPPALRALRPPHQPRTQPLAVRRQEGSRAGRAGRRGARRGAQRGGVAAAGPADSRQPNALRGGARRRGAGAFLTAALAVPRVSRRRALRGPAPASSRPPPGGLVCGCGAGSPTRVPASQPPRADAALTLLLTPPPPTATTPGRHADARVRALPRGGRHQPHGRLILAARRRQLAVAAVRARGALEGERPAAAALVCALAKACGRRVRKELPPRPSWSHVARSG